MKTSSKKTIINQIKEELFESEELYRLLFHNSNDAAFVSLRRIDENMPGRIILVNDIACQRLGYSREELLQMSPLDFSVPLPTIDGFMKKLATDKAIIHEEIHITKDGRKIPVEISTRSLELNGKHVNFSIARDITRHKQLEAELKISQQKYLGLLDNINGIVWEADPETFKFSFVSKQAEAMLGYPAQQWIDEPNFWENHIHPEDRERTVGYCVRCTSEMMAHDFEYRMISVDGRIVWLEDFVTVDSEGNVPVALHGLMLDITKRKQMENELRKSEEENRAIINAVPDLLFRVSRNGVILDFHSAGTSDLYASPEQFLGKNTNDIMPPRIAELSMAAIEKAIQTREQVAFEYELTIQADRRYYEARIIALSNDEVLSIVRDITERKHIEGKLKQLSARDALTNLYNRGFFEEELARIEHGQQFPVSIVMADVDHLKEVNDQQGHAAGDTLLKRAAQVLNSAFRTDDIIARIGGDEFAVILPNTSQTAARKMLIRVRQILQMHNKAQAETSISISFGVSTVDNSTSLMDALKKADEYMYREKRLRQIS